MTKKDIVDRIVQKTGLKYLDVKKVVQMTFDTMAEALTTGEKIELRNFGVFKIKLRKAKKGRNPRTGEEVPVPERKVVVFKPGLELKEKVK
ncbi:MAG: integration host factor subunit beta [Candidatus Omnitrophica bacterium 4484_49]|nr:MAG: integration host factor subunit beta [Candidatus Omnitrophica bacterium 4484_49]